MTNLIVTDLEKMQTLGDQQMATVNGGFSTIFDVFRYWEARSEEVRLKRKISAYMASRKQSRIRRRRPVRRVRRSGGG